MPQSVFDPGEPITSRLKLGVTPDGTTNATVTIKRPDGTALTGLTVSGWGGTGGDEKTVQFWATDDGTMTGTTDEVSGDWLAVWRVTGTGASVTPKVYSVQPLPDPTGRATYTPFMHEIADYVPWLTLDTTTPGGDLFLGTFTGTTWPTDEQVIRVTRRTADPIAARWPTLHETTVAPLARTYITLRVAAHLARSFPRNAGDLETADRLASEAESLWTTLTELSDNTQPPDPTGTGQVPVYSFPAPVSWGDDYL